MIKNCAKLILNSSKISLCIWLVILISHFQQFILPLDNICCVYVRKRSVLKIWNNFACNNMFLGKESVIF